MPERGHCQCPGRAHPHHQGRAGKRSEHLQPACNLGMEPIRWTLQRWPGSNSATATGATKASACWAWRPRRWTAQPGAYSRADENGLTFAGFLLFFDPPKADVQQAIVDLAKRGVQLKIITGDNQKVARHVAEAVNLPVQGVLTGSAAERPARRGALAPGRTHHHLRGSGPQPEGAHHPGAAEDQARGRLYGRRHQRRARPARRGRGHLGGYRRGCGQGSRRFCPAQSRIWASCARASTKAA